MKIKILLAVLLLSFASCKKGHDPQFERKIKSVTGYMSAFGSENKFIADEEVYDENGKLISSIKGNFLYNEPSYYHPLFYFYKDGRLSETKDEGNTRTEYIYNTNNLVSEKNSYYGDFYADKSLIQKEVYTYDNQNRKIKMVSYYYGPVFGHNPPPVSTDGYTYTYEYNAANLVSKQHAGSITTSYEYDSYKNLTKTTYLSPVNPNPFLGSESYSYKYSNSGKVTEIVQSDDAGKVHKLTNLYDEEDRLKTKIVAKDFGGGTYVDISTTTYTYRYF
jgi:YD repeat-containing protein